MTSLSQVPLNSIPHFQNWDHDLERTQQTLTDNRDHAYAQYLAQIFFLKLTSLFIIFVEMKKNIQDNFDIEQ